MGANGEARGLSLTNVFEVVLWGYDREQVARCINDLEDQLSALYAEQRHAAQVAAELERCRIENVALRARLSGVPAVHQVGEEVEGILAAAERQALQIRADADGLLTDAREEAVQIRAAAQHQAAKDRRDCELALREHRRKNEEAANELLTAARQEAERIVADARSATGQQEPDRSAPDQPTRQAPPAEHSRGHFPVNGARPRDVSPEALPQHRTVPALGEESA